MALVVICGQPCSGKSTVADCLAEALRECDPEPVVEVINEGSFHLFRNQSYARMPAEKNLRGVLRTWNEERRAKAAAAYDDQIFDDLVRRFERPDRRNRWDSPLFELWPHRDGVNKLSPAVADTVSYLTKKVDSRTRDVKVLLPTIATQSARGSDASSLYKMDKTTQDVSNAIVDVQSQAFGGPLNSISVGTGLPQLNLSRSVGLPELRRLRRTFIKLAGQTSLSGRPLPSDAGSAKRMFVDYLNRELGNTA